MALEVVSCKHFEDRKIPNVTESTQLYFPIVCRNNVTLLNDVGPRNNNGMVGTRPKSKSHVHSFEHPAIIFQTKR